MQRSCSLLGITFRVPSGGSPIFVILRMVLIIYTWKTWRRKSIMDILNIVFSALNLLATVIIGVINVTWMISRDVFRDKPRAKHYSKKWQEKWPPQSFQLERSYFLVKCDTWRRELTTVRAAPFFIFIIDVRTQVVKRLAFSFYLHHFANSSSVHLT